MNSLNNDFFIDEGACYDPAKKLGENWTGTIQDVLVHPDISNKDKIWAFTRKGVCSEKVHRLSAVAFAREVQHLMRDHRSTEAINVAENFAHGRATRDQLKAAWAAAADAWVAARAAWVAARSDAAARAAWVAARAAWAAAWSDAAADAAWVAARAARAAAAWAAADAMSDAAADAAWVQISIKLLNKYEL